MADVLTTDAWTSVTLTKDEIWFAVDGPFRVHCFGGAAPGANVGATIRQGDSIRFATGQTVYHRTALGHEGDAATFSRVEVST